MPGTSTRGSGAERPALGGAWQRGSGSDNSSRGVAWRGGMQRGVPHSRGGGGGASRARAGQRGRRSRGTKELPPRPRRGVAPAGPILRHAAARPATPPAGLAGPGRLSGNIAHLPQLLQLQPRRRRPGQQAADSTSSDRGETNSSSSRKPVAATARGQDGRAQSSAERKEGIITRVKHRNSTRPGSARLGSAVRGFKVMNQTA